MLIHYGGSGSTVSVAIEPIKGINSYSFTIRGRYDEYTSFAVDGDKQTIIDHMPPAEPTKVSYPIPVIERATLPDGSYHYRNTILDAVRADFSSLDEDVIKDIYEIAFDEWDKASQQGLSINDPKDISQKISKSLVVTVMILLSVCLCFLFFS